MKQREIKFRAWNKSKKEWIEDFSFVGGDWWIDEYKNDSLENKRPFENSELMQYTGLKDKNGKEIYEGDIVIHGNNTGVPKRQYIIEWKDGMFICQYPPKDETDYEMSYVDDKDNHKALRSYASFNGAIIEVIGNIYENSEELKNNRGDDSAKYEGDSKNN